jgi:competence protein ComEC
VFDAGVGRTHNSTILSRFLKYYGIDQIDYLFISHAHADHYNSVNPVISDGIKINHLIHKENALESYHFQDFDLKLFNLNQHQTNENNNSLVILFLNKRYHFLLMGDLEIPGEQQLLANEEFRMIINH